MEFFVIKGGYDKGFYGIQIKMEHLSNILSYYN